MPRLKLTSAAIEKFNNSNDRRQEFFDKLNVLPIHISYIKLGSKLG